ncbi:MAG: zinc ribbon domain-containing protein [Acetobacterium sp.]|nr:zinc ribbon domain-containing protein [Bacillota bacterium]MCG2730239.1 zinc ribbon domain-containing protein [Acetobacterium sp.]
MSRSYDDNDSRRHDHHHGLVGSILDFVEDEDALKMSKNQPQAAIQPDTMVCSHCKTVIPAHSKFCPECGLKQTDALHCTNCGSTLAANSKFCLNCGQKVSQ